MLFTAFLLAAFLKATVRADDPIVSLSYARFQGASTDGIDRFLGIPYAQPPVGNLRFRRPQPPHPLPGTTPVSNFVLFRVRG